jgi:hypothetical protein
LPSKIPKLPNYPISVTWLSGWSNYLTQFATWNLHIAKITQFLSPGWVGSSITWTDSSHLVQWAIQLPYPICHVKSPNWQNYPISVSQLSGQSHYPTQFATWNLQVAKITPFLSPGWVGHSITLPNLPPKISKLPKLPNFCHPVEWAIQLPHLICHLKSTICQNHPISVTWLSGQSNYLTWSLSPSWVGDPISPPDLPPEISKLPKLPHFSHPVEWAMQLPHPICHLESTNCQNYPIFVTRLSGQFNYPSQFAIWNLQIAKITQFLSPSWVGDPLTPPDLPLEIHKLPKLPHFCHLLEWAIQLPNLIPKLISPHCHNYPIFVTQLSG